MAGVITESVSDLNRAGPTLDTGAQVGTLGGSGGAQPDAVTRKHPALTIATGDVLDPLSIVTAISGVDAVIAAFGRRKTNSPAR